ncbi:gp436 family protein [Tistrella sp.]|uniref:DUF1320 domain-containing protein n=1 Tax=Tistrella mobilis TaxID=171437 RepID=A0A3B9IIP5_9PROT|nr:DUF1320 domain-containing protein [Tistrella sp.]MAD39572.1 hypothetical protein [Tistrella sp.]HAE47586.1 DUF1320 domain-containing protein [Tistrella mobilis]|tara:strand:- start:504 stop:935 length:432 start_codon:yes stop_codon:yes gene_type:complete
MPHYATLDDLVLAAGQEEINQIADRDGSGAPDPEAVEAALTRADSIINGYVAGRYALPLAEVPALVRTWAVAIARYSLHRYDLDKESRPRVDYEDAMRDLRDLAAGKVTLPIADGSQPAQAGGGTVMAAHPRRPRFSPEGWLR